MKLDLNCDLGEGESAPILRALMRWITSANIACGGHAGNVISMEECIRLAKRQNVRLGAHPGLWDRPGLGRQAIPLSPEELRLLILHQVSALERIASYNGMRLHHVKLHGALYHLSEQDDALCQCYVATVARFWPSLKIFALAGGRIAAAGRNSGVQVWNEAFADRAYLDDGTLVARQEPQARISDPAKVVARATRLLRTGTLESVSGKILSLSAKTLCVHADTPGAEKLVRAVAGVLRRPYSRRPVLAGSQSAKKIGVFRPRGS